MVYIYNIYFYTVVNYFFYLKDFEIIISIIIIMIILGAYLPFITQTPVKQGYVWQVSL